MFKVCLDPGHGGNDRANKGHSGYVEADGVLDVAIKTRDILRKYPIEVVLTRDRDMTLDPPERIKKVNDTNADIVVSIHTNAGPKEANGTETYYSIFSQPGKGGHKLATLIQKYVVEECGTFNRGIKTRKGSNGLDYYFMIRETKMPAVIVEGAFHTNTDEEKLLKTDEFRIKYAKGIAKGILEYAGISWKDRQDSLYKVQLGAFSNHENAKKLADKLKQMGYDTYIVEEDKK
ncbi:MAG: N-acetylmuramoyl-L-alanine amidase [Tepidanaerobacteraceae bacterium]|nr:N-acetylmuramoyl-L-alanine amidase [Tepidanaerobacteraceae bacterium]